MFIEKALIASIFVTIVLGTLLPMIVVIPSAPNPFNDLSGALNVNNPSSGPTSGGTVNQSNSTNLSPGQAQNIGCGASIVTGAVGGAVVGSFFAGIGAIPGAIGGAIIGGVAGCAVIPAVSPSTIQNFGNAIQGAANSAGIGGITSLLGQLVGVVNGLLKFMGDYLGYMAAIQDVDPVINVVLGFDFSFTVLLGGLYFIRVMRGSEG